MPIILIEVRKSYSQEQEITLMQAAHKSLKDAFNIVNNDIQVRFISHEPHRFSIPETHPTLYTHPELYTQVTVDCIVGRSLELKRNLYQNMVNSFEKLGIPKDHIKILIRETSKDNWGIRGGIPASEIDLGYKITN